MKYLLILLFAITANAEQLIWQDEFNGTELDKGKWNQFQPGARLDGTNSDTQLSVHDGALHLYVTSKNGKVYTPMISTEGIFEQSYGTWEFRVKWHDAPATWSDAWLYSRTVVTMEHDLNNAGMEIDIFEHRLIDIFKRPIDNLLSHGIHYNGYYQYHQCYSNVTVFDSDEPWHIIELKRSKFQTTWIVDGIKTLSTNVVTSKPLFLILSTEVSNGNWAGYIPKEGYGNLETMTVDYVRFYAPN